MARVCQFAAGCRTSALLVRVLLSGNATFDGVLIPTWDSFPLILLGMLTPWSGWSESSVCMIIQLAHLEAK